MSANYLRKSVYAATLLLLSGAFAFTPSLQPVAMAQNNISGDIAGVVTDPAGAAIPNASVTVTSNATGATKTVTSGGRGEYRVSLLSPGEYTVVTSAPGFEGSKTTIIISAGVVATSDVKMVLGKTSTVVDVAASEALLHTEDAQISTSFSMEQVQSLPNPGNDLTFVAQTTPGAVMNTQGGYGNFSVNGLPGTSNTFTINGAYQGDPYLNLNNSGATNLLLGNNDISDVTVTTNAYDAAFGGLGGAQVNEISRAGSNGFHGDATYYWNGRIMNANDFFNNRAGTARQFVNANQYNAAIGGPIKKDKIFFFVNTEGLRVIIPNRGNVYAPSPAYQAAILGPAQTNGYAPYGNLAANGLSSEASLYQTIFNYYNNAPGFSSYSADPAGDLDTVVFNGTSSNFGHEYLVTGRVDFNLGANDKMFIHFRDDQGTQPTFTSFLSPVFNASSPQPSYGGELGETHTFSPSVTNQFLFGASYYRAIFINTSAKTLVPTVPFVQIPEGFFGPANCDPAVTSCVQGSTGGEWDAAGNAANWVGGEDFAFPQGRNVTGYQFNDDLSISRGNHTIKLGFTMRRDDITDYSSSEHDINQAGAESILLDQGDFAAGYVDEWAERFPQRLNEPVALYVMGAYVQDQWKALPNLTLTAGLRLEHNSNPICLTNCFSNLAGSFASLSTDTTTPYNQLINANLHRAFHSQQNIAYEPRVGFSWLPGGVGSHTTVRGGFGMFSDYFPAQIAGDLLSNPPNVARFTILGAYFGNATVLNPADPNSAHTIASVSNTAFQADFPTGGSYSSIHTATGGFFRRPTISAVAPKIFLPSYEEYSLGIEHQFTRNIAAAVNYVGNHGYHEPVSNLPNAFDPAGDVASLPTSYPNPSLASVTYYYSGASSNYNGVQATVTGRSRLGTLQFNYSFSHALDEISNGGFDAFGVNPSGQINPNNLAQNYGNADYDTRHYISASYVLNVPYYGGPHVLVDNWQIAGTVFHNTGYPFSEGYANGNVTYGTAPLAAQISKVSDTHCGGESHTVTPCAFVNSYGAPTDYGQQERNQLFGPNYTDFDLDISKGIKLPFWESANLKVGAQFFNLFNHPNFQIPGADASASGTNGIIQSTASTPTSILGAFLGGDASPRLIQLKGTFTF